MRQSTRKGDMVPGAHGKPEAKVKSWEERFARQFRTGVRWLSSLPRPPAYRKAVFVYIRSEHYDLIRALVSGKTRSDLYCASSAKLSQRGPRRSLSLSSFGCFLASESADRLPSRD